MAPLFAHWFVQKTAATVTSSFTFPSFLSQAPPLTLHVSPLQNIPQIFYHIVYSVLSKTPKISARATQFGPESSAANPARTRRNSHHSAVFAARRKQSSDGNFWTGDPSGIWTPDPLLKRQIQVLYLHYFGPIIDLYMTCTLPTFGLPPREIQVKLIHGLALVNGVQVRVDP